MHHHPIPSKSMSSRINAQTPGSLECRRKSGEVTASAKKGLFQVVMTTRSCKMFAPVQHG